MKITLKFWLVFACAASLALAGNLSAQTRHEVVHTFSGNGGRPLGGLAQGPDGRLYGTTISGGSLGKGSIYATDGLGGTSTIHEFSGTDGEAPRGRLLIASEGTIYGTTSQSTSGFGTVFRVLPDGTFDTLAHFTGPNGASPQGGLVRGGDGALYGTTLTGGSGGVGTVFRITDAGTLTTVVSFSDADGAFPEGDLFEGLSGVLYGTTRLGGPSGMGTVFSVSLGGTLTTIAAFNGANGAFPTNGPIEASDGILYGTTFAGGASGMGTLFRIAGGTLETLVAFSGADGEMPQGALRQFSDGIYGTTREGGVSDAGTVFRLALDGTFATVASMTGTDGLFPGGGVIQAGNGAIYGTTESGGPGTYGTVFELMGDGSLLTVASFTGTTGAGPVGRLLQAGDGNWYGATSLGGQHGFGTVFRLAPDGTVTTLASLDRDNAFPSSGLLRAADGNLYGTTEAGGIGDGSVYRVTLDGTLTTLATFDFFVNGATPIGGLTEGSDGQLYGTTLVGANFAPGAVFRVNPADGIITVMATFADDGSQGTFPIAGVIEVNGRLYGTAEQGGANGFGTIFEVSAAGLSAVASFTDVDPFPSSPLLLASDGNLYGTTAGDGFLAAGTVFQFAPGGALTTVATFDFANGALPYQQGLVEGADGSLYGTTQLGGANGFGGVYRWSPSTGLTAVHGFDGLSGDGPNSTLARSADGALYGTTNGPRGGTIYRIVSDVVPSALAVAPAAGTYGGVATFAATLSASGAGMAGGVVAFTLNGVAIGSATTGADGVASLADISIAGLDAGTYPGAVAASFAGADGVQGTTATGDLAIARAVPAVTVNSASYTFDGLAHPATGSVTGVGGEDLGPLTFAYNGQPAPPVDPGSYAVVGSYAGSLNYEPASAAGLITIAPASVPGLAGLVAAYGFEEGAGDVAGDASGKGLSGAIKQAQWVAGGRFGRGLLFDGRNDWVTVADAAALDIRNAITLEAWVKPRALAGWNTILMKEGDGRLAYALYANSPANLPAGYIGIVGTDEDVRGNAPLAIDAWTHVAMTYDGTTMRLYLNGVEAGRRYEPGRLVATGKPLRIGGNNTWGEFFNGVIDEVRIYGRQLSADEINRDINWPIAIESIPPSVSITSPSNNAVLSGVPAVSVAAADNLAISSVQLQVDGADAGAPLASAPFTFRLDAANGTHVLRAVARDVAGNVTMSDSVTVTIDNAPVADFNFNEGAGAAVLDASGLNNHGAITGGATWAIDATRGSVLSFNGVDGLVSVADAGSLDLTTGMTLEAWVRPTAFDGWRTAILKEGNGLAYALYASDNDSGPAGYARINFVDQAVRVRKKVPFAAWTHIAMTYDGAMMRLFVNGVEVQSRKQTGAADVSAGALRIGGNRVWGEWFRGQMDNVVIYNVAVGAEQIKADMQR